MVALFLTALAGTATAASLDLPKWVIVPEDSSFSDVTLFCPLDAYDASTNTTPCYYQGNVTNAQIYFNSTTGYPKLVSGQIGNAFEFDNGDNEYVGVSTSLGRKGTIVGQYYPEGLGYTDTVFRFEGSDGRIFLRWTSGGTKTLMIRIDNITSWQFFYPVDTSSLVGKWYFWRLSWDMDAMKLYFDLYDESGNKIYSGTLDITTQMAWPAEGFGAGTFYISHRNPNEGAYGKIDEIRVYDRVLTDDEIKLLYAAGRKKLSELAQFRQIFSPMIDLTRDRATFYAGLEVSTSDPSGYVPVPESAVNMSITSAPRLKSDYTNADFYYQGHYWYRADKIQFNLPIQFETVRESGGFSKEILLDEDKKTFVYEKEFKVTNPTAAKLNVVYMVDPTALGFSVLQYPAFELDGVSMAEWSPSNSSTLYLIRTDSLEPGEISTHWIKSTWTITKEELEFPAKLDDFRSITDWRAAQKLAENAAEGKTDTYVKVIKIDSNADVSNVTILVPLADVKDEDDVIEAVALTGARDTLQVEKLSDGKVVVKVPGQDFVSGHAEIKVLYNKSGGSWFSQLLDKIRSLIAKIKSLFFGGG